MKLTLMGYLYWEYFISIYIHIYVIYILLHVYIEYIHIITFVELFIQSTIETTTFIQSRKLRFAEFSEV